MICLCLLFYSHSYSHCFFVLTALISWCQLQLQIRLSAPSPSLVSHKHCPYSRNFLTFLGNGPSALFLSFLLHGNVPYYDPSSSYGPHPDIVLNRLLQPYIYDERGLSKLSLLDAVRDAEILNYIELGYSSFFSANTSPASLLLDALVASDEASFASLETKETRIKWVHDKDAVVEHVVLGSSLTPGGQWSSGNTPDDTEEKSLSYAEMLSLPGFSFTEFYRSFVKSQEDGLLSFTRPKRGDIAKYYDEYSKVMGLRPSFRLGTIVTNVELSSSDSSSSNVYTVDYTDVTDNTKHSIKTWRIVLASGVFEKPLKELASATLPCSELTNSDDHEKLLQALRHASAQPFINETHVPIVPPPQNFQDIATMEPSLIVPSRPPSPTSHPTFLIIGSGVSAAEAVNQCSKYAGVHTIHIYRWFEDDPGPLRRFSRETYPEYARVYKLMKRFAKEQDATVSPDFFSEGSTYEGIPNSLVLSMSLNGKVTIRLESGAVVTRCVSSIKVCTGRSGSLAYLSPDICTQAGFPVNKQIDGESNPVDESVNLNAVSKTFLQPYLLANKSSSVSLCKEPSSNSTINSICSSATNTSSCCSSSCDEQSLASQSKASSPASSVAADDDESHVDDDYMINPKEVPPASPPSYNLKLCGGIYAIGSLAGETLVRLMLGGCVWVAGDIKRARKTGTW